MNEQTKEEIRRALDRILEPAREGGRETLLEAMVELERLSASPGLPDHLQHYLMNRSYAKARDFLDGRPQAHSH